MYVGWAASLGISVVAQAPYAAFRRSYLERQHLEFWALIRAIREDEQARGVTLSPWYALVPQVASTLNSTPVAGDITPNDLIFAAAPKPPPSNSPRPPNPPNLDAFINRHGNALDYDDAKYKSYVEAKRRSFQDMLKTFHEHTLSRLRKTAFKMAEKSRRPRASNLAPYKKGDLLWVAANSINKLKPRWTGPFKCMGGEEVTGSAQLVEISSLSDQPRGQVHISNVKLAVLSDEQLDVYCGRDKSQPTTTSAVFPVSGDIPTVKSEQFPAMRHFMIEGGDKEGQLLVARSVVPIKDSTGLWLQCDQ
ncbi:hypothetical protein Pmar_PMAR008356, partial [Perkinsus marinus ATCC 50983]